MVRELPQPPDAGVLNALRFGTGTFRFLEGMQSRFDDVVGIPIPGRPPLVVVTAPDLIHDVLSRPDEFGRVPATGAAALIAERGLVQSEGDLWRQQRSVVGPAFAGEQVRVYADTVGRRVEALADEWNAALDAPETDDSGTTTATDGSAPALRRSLHREMTSLTIRVASEVLLGEDIGRGRAESFHDWMRVAGDEFEFGLDAVTPEWIPEWISSGFREAADGILGLAEELIDRRRAEFAEGGPEGPKDMLTLLLEAEDDPEVDYPPNQIRDEVATFLIAGHETTALSLTYTGALLAWHPAARERVRAEAQAVIGGDRPRHEHVADLEYTGRVFREALRLYPPAWAVFRRAAADVRLGDYRVPDGSAVVLPQWSVHRDPRYFDDPGAFDPDRWAGRAPRSVDAYFPFGGGPHACIGRQFSLTGAPLALAGIARDFDVDVPENALDDLQVSPTLRPKRGIPATIRRAL